MIFHQRSRKKATATDKEKLASVWILSAENETSCGRLDKPLSSKDIQSGKSNDRGYHMIFTMM